MPEGQRKFHEPLMGNISRALERYNATTLWNSIRKGKWKALLSFLKGENPGLKDLQEAMTEIQNEIRRMYYISEQVKSLTPEERGQFIDLIHELWHLIIQVIYDLGNTTEKPYNGPLKESENGLEEFLSTLLNSCRLAEYPRWLVPERHTELMNKVDSGGIVCSDELARKPRSKDYREAFCLQIF